MYNRAINIRSKCQHITVSYIREWVVGGTSCGTISADRVHYCIGLHVRCGRIMRVLLASRGAPSAESGTTWSHLWKTRDVGY